MYPPIGDEQLPREGRLAGVDFGTVRLGVAVSDPGQRLASPYDNYTRRSERQDAQYFRELVKNEQIVAFVVGLPVHMSGDESQKSRQAREFGTWLNSVTGLPIGWVDERFSTAMAREVLSQSTLSGKKKKSQLDKLAAQILLTAYLESGRSRSPDSL